MRIFLAFPFTQHLKRGGDGTWHFDAHVQAFLLRIEAALCSAGHSVFLSHRRESFGANLWAPDRAAVFDFLEMQRANCVVAFPGTSYGVHIEIGWASAMNKPVILVAEESESTPLLTGLGYGADVRVVKPRSDLSVGSFGQSELCDEICAALPSLPKRREPNSYAFLSTSFGFGPVSKAVTIARELAVREPDASLHYFGAGVDYDFAKKAAVFDRILRIDVDNRELLHELVPQLEHYRAVVSVLNLDILPLWKPGPGSPPLYLVDSLAWMWPSVPDAVSRATTYFVQDYLFPVDRARSWSEHSHLQLVGPIRPTLHVSRNNRNGSPRRLIVNFSGCASPFAPEEVLRRYVEVLAYAVLGNAASFGEITIACNERLSEHLRRVLPGAASHQIGHFPHMEFLNMLAGCDALLTTPGITTTLEADLFGKPMRFLLPQNYSQARMSEMYRSQAGDHSCMAFSRFGPEFVIETDIPEQEGVARVVGYLETVLKNRRADVNAMVGELIESLAGGQMLKLPHSTSGNVLAYPGQKIIVDQILARSAVAAV
jgi:hypothetical protein